jgi:hypothetical protein
MYTLCYGDNCRQEVITMFKQILCLFIAAELGLFGWLFLKDKEPKIETPSVALLHQEVEGVEDVKGVDSTLMSLSSLFGGENLDQAILSLIPHLIKELQQFAKIQKELINSDTLQRLNEYQLSDIQENSGGNNEIILELIRRLQEDPTNDPNVNKMYKWVEDELTENMELWNRTLNGQDSFDEKRVVENY